MFGAEAMRGGSVAGPKGLSVLALDPGETTGWAWAVVAYKELNVVRAGGCDWASFWSRVIGSERFQCGQEETYRGPISGSSVAVKTLYQEAHTARVLGGLIEDLHGLTKIRSNGSVGWLTDLVIEDFVLRERTKQRNLLAPVRLTAAVAQEVLLSDRLIGVTIQSPSDAKSVVTDERLKQLGLWQTGQVHARDACRHLALFLRKLTVD